MIRVFLLDDHEIVRRGVREVLEGQPDIEVVGEAGTAEEAYGRIPATSPHVALLDLRLPDGDGIEVCREVRSRHPEIECIILTSFADDDAVYAAILAGAAGSAQNLNNLGPSTLVRALAAAVIAASRAFTSRNAAAHSGAACCSMKRTISCARRGLPLLDLCCAWKR